MISPRSPRHLAKPLLAAAVLLAIAAAPRAALAYNRLHFSGGPVLSPEIVPLHWGNWTGAQQNANTTYLQGFAGYLAGVGAPLGQEPVTKQYGVWDAHVTWGASIGVGSDTLVRNTGIYQRIHALQATGQLPPNTPNRIFVVFLSGFQYDFSDASGVDGSTCAYHSLNNGTYYAVIPAERLTAPNGQNCSIQNAVSHEVMEAATDPYPWNGWVTDEYGGFGHAEGGDQCQGAGTSLPFGFVQPFSDNTINGCASFTNSTTTHLGVARDGVSYLDVFWASGTPGVIGHARYDGTWSSELITHAGAQAYNIAFLGAPSVVRSTNTRLDVFVRGSDGGIYHVFKDRWGANTWTWLSTMSNSMGQVSAVSWGSNRIDLVTLGNDSSVLHYWTNDATNFSSESMGGQTIGPPKIISRGYGLVDIFTFGMHGDIVENSWVNGWSNYHVIVSNSSGLTIPPAITSWDVNRKDVFTGGTGGFNGSLALHTAWTGSWENQWHGWVTPYGSPAATTDGSGLDLAWEGNDRAAHYQNYNKTTGVWATPMNLYGVYDGPPAIAYGGDGRVYIVGIGTDGCLYFNQSANAQKTAWNGPYWTGVCGLR